MIFQDPAKVKKLGANTAKKWSPISGDVATERPSAKKESQTYILEELEVKTPFKKIYVQRENNSMLPIKTPYI